MPLFLKKAPNNRFFVSDGKKNLSHKGLPRETALRQRVAVALNIHEKRGIPLKKLFA